MATHESGRLDPPVYDRVERGVGSASYAISADRGYQGSAYSAKARFEGSTDPPPSAAFGGFEVNVKDGYRGTYAAALWFPPGTLTGTQPGQRGDVDVMRWDNASEFGGIRISGSTHKASLVRGSPAAVDRIGDTFSFQEGCWNWVVVRQKLSEAAWNEPDHALNEVFLNGRKVVESHAPNKFSGDGGAGTVRFGLPYIDHAAQGASSFEFYVDDAYVSTGELRAPGPGACQPPKPNILFVVTDDQPAIDTMHVMPKTTKWFRDGAVENGDVIKGGTEFSEAYATTPLCCPSRASILSGKYAHNHGVRQNELAGNLAQDSQVQRYLDDAGYRTGIVGKYLNQWNTYIPPPHFDRWTVFVGGYSGYFNDNGTIQDVKSYSTGYIGQKANQFIDEAEANDSDPWFLYVTPYGPHSAGNYPYGVMDEAAYSPPGYYPPLPPATPSRSEGAPGGDPLDDKPNWVKSWLDLRTMLFRDPNNTAGGGLRDQQLRALRSVDDMVESILQKLKASGEERDTLAVFLSDNGFMWREHGVAANETGPSGCPTFCGLSGKDKPYTEAIKVPFFMRWPANTQVAAGAVDGGRIAANIDLAPTALSVAGVAPDASDPMDGRSLLDRSQARSEVLTEGWNSTAAGTWAGLRSLTYHYIEYYERDGATIRQENGAPLREYYDLRNDPYELTNLFRDSDPDTPDPAFAAELSARLRQARLCEGSNCLPGAGGGSSDTKAPTLSLTNPTAGAIVDGTVYLAADASDNLGVESVEFRRDGVLLGTDTEFPYKATWDASAAAPGPHELRTVAKDAAGNTGTDVLTVDVDRFDVQTSNGGGSGQVQGRLESGDRVTYTFNRPIAPSTFVSGWDGSTRTVTARISPDDPLQGYNDTLTVLGVGALGVLDLGVADFWGWRMSPQINANFNSSTIAMAADQRSLTLTLGGLGPLGTTASKGSLVWTPTSAVCSTASPCRIIESGGTPDSDF